MENFQTLNDELRGPLVQTLPAESSKLYVRLRSANTTEPQHGVSPRLHRSLLLGLLDIPLIQPLVRDLQEPQSEARVHDTIEEVLFITYSDASAYLLYTRRPGSLYQNVVSLQEKYPDFITEAERDLYVSAFRTLAAASSRARSQGIEEINFDPSIAARTYGPDRPDLVLTYPFTHGHGARISVPALVCEIKHNVLTGRVTAMRKSFVQTICYLLLCHHYYGTTYGLAFFGSRFRRVKIVDAQTIALDVPQGQLDDSTTLAQYCEEHFDQYANEDWVHDLADVTEESRATLDTYEQWMQDVYEWSHRRAWSGATRSDVHLEMGHQIGTQMSVPGPLGLASLAHKAGALEATAGSKAADLLVGKKGSRKSSRSSQKSTKGIQLPTGLALLGRKGRSASDPYPTTTEAQPELRRSSRLRPSNRDAQSWPGLVTATSATLIDGMSTFGSFPVGFPSDRTLADSSADPPVSVDMDAQDRLYKKLRLQAIVREEAEDEEPGDWRPEEVEVMMKMCGHMRLVAL